MTETTDRELPIDDNSDKPQIHRAILAATRDMPTIAKTGAMDLGGKSVPFTKIDDIRAHLYPILERHGINTYMSVKKDILTTQVADPVLSGPQVDPDTKMVSPNYRPIGDGRIGTTRSRANVTIGMRFVYAGDGSEVEVEAPGESYDTNGDKATSKATTSAVKRIFTETFKIVDREEKDIEGDDPEARNRPATTDVTQPDRGAQQREAAAGAGAGGSGTRRSGPQRSVTTTPSPAAAAAKTEAEEADPATGELPAAATAPAPSTLDVQKARVRNLNAKLGLAPAEVNALATSLTGYAQREGENGWITKVTAVKKLADELEVRAKAKESGE